jgi:peptidyl-prolyl cis-trans isomerase C
MDMKFYTLLASVSASLTILISSAQAQSTNTSNPAVAAINHTANSVAIVNGQYIAKLALTTLEKEIAERNNGKTLFSKEKLIEELVQRELLIQDATQKQLTGQVT